MIFYNLFPLLAGPFGGWDRHFARAAEMEFDWVLLNPIQKQGASRSLYSVSNYFAVNPGLLDPSDSASGEEQVRRMVRKARAAGRRVMIDLVINHCAIDSALTREHPEWFVREPDGRIASPSCQSDEGRVVWRDLAQFDHRHTRDPEGLYRFCRGVAGHLISLGFEGFRCDAAYQVPAAFWRRLIAEVKTAHPSACFVAETLGCTPAETREIARSGFDFVLNSSKWWNYHDGWLMEQYNLVRDSARSISFPESHDTARLSAELGGNVAGLKQRYLFSALFSSGVMMPIGYEFGFRKRLHVVDTTPADWEETGIDLRGFIASVNSVKRRHTVFREEAPSEILPCHNPNILLLKKRSPSHGAAILILNKDIAGHQEFYAENFRTLLPSRSPLRDVSPEFARDHVPEPFHYGLRPGQGIVLYAQD